MLEDAEVFDVGLVTEFLDKPRRVQVNGRKVAVFTYKGQIYAIDANCYHSAGALEEHSEDIEELNGEPCIRCPLHKYIISLETGHSFYEAVEVIKQPRGKPIIKSLGFRSKGHKQRCHRVTISQNRVLIQLDDEGTLESDKYAYR